MNATVCAALFLSAGAACMDLRQSKVDNGWLLFWLGTGLCIQLIRAGPGMLKACLPGIVIPLLLLFPFFYFRMLGAGDIKTLAVLGSMLGGRAILSCLFLTFLLGAALSLAIFLLDGGWQQRLQYLFSWLRRYLQTGQKTPYIKEGIQEESLHMTIPILMSVLLWAGGWYG